MSTERSNATGDAEARGGPIEWRVEPYDDPANAGTEWRGDIRLDTPLASGVGLDVPAPPEQAARVRAEAVGAARMHLERHARRVRRGRAPTGPWTELELAELRACAIDLETTGGGADADILEVGCVQVAAGERGVEFCTFVRPRQPVQAAAFAVHGIDATQLEGAPEIAAILPYVEELSRDRVLVAHNAPFDVGFLQRAAAAHGRDAFLHPVVDTVVLSRLLLGGRCGLGAAAHRLGIDAPHVHRALPDARLAAMLWLAFVEILQDAGATRLGQVPGAGPQPPPLPPAHRRDA
jgi:DNA polymerase III epsilon subunit family exonuclease